MPVPRHGGVFPVGSIPSGHVFEPQIDRRRCQADSDHAVKRRAPAATTTKERQGTGGAEPQHRVIGNPRQAAKPFIQAGCGGGGDSSIDGFVELEYFAGRLEGSIARGERR